MVTKVKKLKGALAKGYLPKLFSSKERWQNGKCRDYCAVAENYPYGRMVKHSKDIQVAV